MRRQIKQNICLCVIAVLSALLAAYGVLLLKAGYLPPDGEPVTAPLAVAALQLRSGVFPWNYKEKAMELPEWQRAGFADPPGVEEESRTAEGAATGDGADVPQGADLSATESAAVAQESAYGTAALLSGILPVEGAEGVIAAGWVDGFLQGGGSDEVAAGAEDAADRWPPELHHVEEDYFADAVFIGDSRVVGVEAYAPIPGATYYARTSMTIYNMLDSRVSTDDTVSTVRQGLEERLFGKIYLMVGINEIGTASAEYFTEHYRAVLREIRELQPYALIYVQGIMHVDGDKDAHERYINNTNINERNAALAAMSLEEKAVYIDLNEVYDDEDGNLPSDMTGDGVHLYAQCYYDWRDYLYDHALDWTVDWAAVATDLGLPEEAVTEHGIARSWETDEDADADAEAGE